MKTKWQQEPRPFYRQRWLIIYNALVDPREASEIAKHTGTTVAMVHRVIASYNRLGIAGVETSGKGRRRQYRSWKEEQAFLAPFFSRAERGEIATAKEIKRAFEAQVGHEVHKSTISRLLKRHGWRKPMPRPSHPKESLEAQEQFEKTSLPALQQRSRLAHLRTNAQS
ncbi:helix-turn-helix domain-containing protein [Ktedonospora formicarum]|uniref:helix-turn-helix domain-containing protein n=1 Tax=Ktedonospora formicarum TaxID=2778364 RepID=UPI001C68CDC8|nr:winged helix-turn-helix domain-containing protein [Ktedonospora formicarum]